MSKQHWTADNIGDLSGKTFLVTGANSGLGRETARVIAGKMGSVILAVRSSEKGDMAAEEIRREYPEAQVRVMTLDLSSLSSVREFAGKVQAQLDSLDCLINNAGIMMPPYSKTEDGFELQFGTNHLGHFALTGLLFPLLKASPGARVVTVSSEAHKWGHLDFEDLQSEHREYKASRSYGDSKLANLYFTYELARRTEQTKLRVTAAHPGWTATSLQKHSLLFSFFNPLLGQKIPMGALPVLRAALDDGAVNGQYFGPNGFMELKGYPVSVKSSELSYDREIAARLWQVSEELTGVRF